MICCSSTTSTMKLKQVIYVVDDFDTNVNGQSHGNEIYSIIDDRLPNYYIIRKINIKLGTQDSVRQLNESLKNLLNTNVSLINMSFGSDVYDAETLSLLKQFNNKGAIIIAAAGNEHLDFCQYPAAYNINGIISVGSADKNGAIAEYSNYGKQVDIFIGVDKSELPLSGTSAACAEFTHMFLCNNTYISKQSCWEFINKNTITMSCYQYKYKLIVS